MRVSSIHLHNNDDGQFHSSTQQWRWNYIYTLARTISTHFHEWRHSLLTRVLYLHTFTNYIYTLSRTISTHFHEWRHSLLTRVLYLHTFSEVTSIVLVDDGSLHSSQLHRRVDICRVDLYTTDIYTTMELTLMNIYTLSLESFWRDPCRTSINESCHTYEMHDSVTHNVKKKLFQTVSSWLDI